MFFLRSIAHYAVKKPTIENVVVLIVHGTQRQVTNEYDEASKTYHIFYRVFCLKCIDHLVPSGELECDGWLCFLCDNKISRELSMAVRDNWADHVLDLHKKYNDPHSRMSNIHFENKRPLTVLSVFDGISAGK